METKRALRHGLGIPALLTLLVVPLAYAPARAQTTAPVRQTLRAENVIRGSQASYIEVSVPRDARISGTIRPRREKGPTSDVDISHVDQGTAVALVPDPLPASAVTSDGFFIAGEFERCFAPECVSPKRISYQFPGVYPQYGKPSWVAIPAGDYRLYLVAQAPTKVTLRLDGLGGTVRLFPRSAAQLDLRTPQENVAYDQTGSVFSAGATYAEARTGIIVMVLYAKADIETDFEFGLCDYADDEPPPEEVAYGPNCTAFADGAGAVGAFPRTRSFELTAMFDYSSEGGERSLGGWISTAATIETAGSHAFLLGF